MPLLDICSWRVAVHTKWHPVCGADWVSQRWHGVPPVDGGSGSSDHRLVEALDFREGIDGQARVCHEPTSCSSRLAGAATDDDLCAAMGWLLASEEGIQQELGPFTEASWGGIQRATDSDECEVYGVVKIGPRERPGLSPRAARGPVRS